MGRDPSEEVGSIPTGSPFSSPSAPKAFDWGRNREFSRRGGCFAGVRPFFGKSYQRITRRALYCSARFFVGSGISTELSNPNRIPFTCAFRKNPFPHCPVRTAVLGACSEPPGEGPTSGMSGKPPFSSLILNESLCRGWGRSVCPFHGDSSESPSRPLSFFLNQNPQ